MTTHESRQEALLEALQDDQARFETLIGRLSDEELQRPFTSEGWSIKDFLAHMTHWKRAGHAALVAYTHDQPPPPALPSGDEANAQQYPLEAARTLEEVKDDWLKVHTYMRHLVVDELDETRLSEEVRAPWNEHRMLTIYDLVNDLHEHDGEHFVLIEQHFH